MRSGVTSADAEEVKALRREVRELRRANEILRKASAYFRGDLQHVTDRPGGARPPTAALKAMIRRLVDERDDHRVADRAGRRATRLDVEIRRPARARRRPGAVDR